MTVFLLFCRNYAFFISFWLLFPSLWFPLWGLPQIAWKSTKILPPVSALKEDVEIREVLEEILKNYAENPGRVRLHPQIQGKVRDSAEGKDHGRNFRPTLGSPWIEPDGR